MNVRYFAEFYPDAHSANKKRKIPICSNESLERCFNRKLNICSIDDMGSTVLIAKNGKWLQSKPNINANTEHVETSNPSVLPELIASTTQTAADVAYLSMMTGVSL